MWLLKWETRLELLAIPCMKRNKLLLEDFQQNNCLGNVGNFIEQCMWKDHLLLKASHVDLPIYLK